MREPIASGAEGPPLHERAEWAPSHERVRVMPVWCRLAAVLWLVVAAGLQARPHAQTIEQVTFDEAVRRAVTSHPTIRQAAAGILRAESILQQVRARSLPSLEATFSANVIDPVTRFSGSSINPRTQTVTTAGLSVPLLTPVRWAERNQAEDDVLVSLRAADDARRAVAIAAGEAYLAVITQRRVLELNARARDNARAHYEFANQRFEGGVGSRLNALRAQQELSGDEARVEDARLAIRRAQEALGVLIAADGPVDAGAAPVFEVPPEIGSVTALFSPTVLAPTGLFANTRSWRASVLFAVPLFDAGQRRGQAREREALVDVARAERLNAERQASSEIRTAREAVAATERALEHARAAAAQANEVLSITDVAFREGATTNIEVIDAQRGARDAETAAAIADDAVRRAKLELLVATGRFPS